jgi:hypothetical protein
MQTVIQNRRKPALTNQLCRGILEYQKHVDLYNELVRLSVGIYMKRGRAESGMLINKVKKTTRSDRESALTSLEIMV